MQRRRPPPFLRVLPIECGLKPLSVHSKSRIEASSLLRAVTTTEPLHEAHRDVKIIEIRIVRKCVSVVSEPMVRSSKWTPVDILRLPNVDHLPRQVGVRLDQVRRRPPKNAPTRTHPTRDRRAAIDRVGDSTAPTCRIEVWKRCLLAFVRVCVGQPNANGERRRAGDSGEPANSRQTEGANRRSLDRFC
jgi:hypothetical protein